MVNTIPVSQRNQLKNEVLSCVVEEGEPLEKCLMSTARAHGLNRKQTQDLAHDLMDGSEEE